MFYCCFAGISNFQRTVTLIPDVPVGSVIARLSDGLTRSRKSGIYDSAGGCPKDSTSSRCPLSLDSVSGYVRTTSAFKAIPGRTLTATFSVPVMNNKTFQMTLVVHIICPFDSTQKFYRDLIKPALDYWNKFRCLDRTYFHAESRNVRLSPPVYTYSFHRKMSYYDSLALEIDMNRFPRYYFNNSDIIMINFRAFSSYYSNPNVSVRIIRRSLVFSAKAKTKDNIVRVPIDKVFKFNLQQINVTFQVTGHSALLKNSSSGSKVRVNYIPFVEGAVKLVILSRSSEKCSKSQCPEPSKTAKNWNVSSEACLTTEQLYSACYGKFNLLCLPKSLERLGI